MRSNLIVEYGSAYDLETTSPLLLCRIRTPVIQGALGLRVGPPSVAEPDDPLGNVLDLGRMVRNDDHRTSVAV